MDDDRKSWGAARVAYIAVEPRVRERVIQGFPLKEIWRELAPGMSYRTFTFWRRRREEPPARRAASSIAEVAISSPPPQPRRWDPANLDRDGLLGPVRPRS